MGGWNLVVSKLDPADSPALFFAYADAYLDSAKRLCKVLARSNRKATFERGAVVLFLSAHAVELFLKGAISLKAPRERFGHDLAALKVRYNKLYAAKRFHFRPPFGTVQLLPPEWPVPPRNHPTESERFRYPGNNDYVPWQGAYGFEAGSFLLVLHALERDFARLQSVFQVDGQVPAGPIHRQRRTGR